MTLDPKTLHGTHYTEEQFDQELERRLNEQIAQDGAAWDEGDRSSYKRHFLRQIYQEWNPETDQDDFIQFEMANSLKYSGYATSGYVSQSDTDGNPLLEPIHGISLNDYAAIVMNITNYDENTLFSAFGIDQAIWGEINVLWPKRMQEDETFTVATLYGEAFMHAPNHPIILSLADGKEPSASNENLDRMRTDKYFYLELSAARTAAYAYGLDGAQWIEDKFGISLMDFQAVAMEWMTNRNQNFDSNEIQDDHDYQQAKEEEYKAMFAAEQGSNIADDIDF